MNKKNKENLMKFNFIFFTITILALSGFGQAALSTTKNDTRNKPVKEILSRMVHAKRQNSSFALITPGDISKLSPAEQKALELSDNPCNTVVSISFEQSVNGSLTSADCRLEDGSYGDFYSFNGAAGQKITVSLNSDAFDAYLGLASEDETFIIEDDDGGGGTNSRIVATLPTTGLYFILANSSSPNEFGNYTLLLSSGTPPPCSYSLNTPGSTIPATGGTFTFTINTQAGCQWIAVSTSSFITTDSLGVSSGTISYTVSANTISNMRSGAIIVRGQTFTINQAAANSPLLRKTRFDYDGDGKSDLSVFRPSTGGWYLQNSSSGFSAVAFGAATDRIVPEDYDGDGRTDIAVYRDGLWYILKSSDSKFLGVAFGSPTDIPAPADFDGDGRAELTVYRPSSGSWYSFNLVNNAFTSVKFGASEDKPVVADYDGDGRADYAVYRPSSGRWYILQSQAGFIDVAFGISTDKAVPADYDGDGKTDIAVYRNGNWYIIKSSNSAILGVAFGAPTDVPATADYNGDGKAEVAVYRPSSGSWYVLNLTNNAFSGIQFGASGDIPTQNAFVFQVDN
jgi:hypothetical protein